MLKLQIFVEDASEEGGALVCTGMVCANAVVVPAVGSIIELNGLSRSRTVSDYAVVNIRYPLGALNNTSRIQVIVRKMEIPLRDYDLPAKESDAF